MTTSDDARAILLLCSSVAFARGEEAKPFGPRTWAKLSALLDGAGVTPAELLGLNAAAIGRIVGGDDADADRLARLLARSGQLGFELDRLATRGITAPTLADDAYPTRWRARLGPDAPPVLFVAGERSILEAGGVAVVGSRDVDPDGEAFAAEVAAGAAREGRVVVSGGARGVDQVALRAALEAGGRVVGMLPEGIERRVREPETRAAIAEGLAVIASPYHPGAAFSAGAAIARNKLIYALADAAVVVASAAGSGGTWAGAVEAITARWVPVYVRTGEGVPPGNTALIGRGGIALTEPVVPVVPPAGEASPSGEPAAEPVAESAAPTEPFEQAAFDWGDGA